MNSTDALACSIKWAVLVGILVTLVLMVFCIVGIKCKSKDDRQLYDGGYTGGYMYGPRN